MSGGSRGETRTVEWSTSRERTGRIAEGTLGRLRRAVTATAFWTGVALPLAYPVFVTTPEPQVSALLGLFSAHVVSLLVGHGHRR